MSSLAAGISLTPCPGCRRGRSPRVTLPADDRPLELETSDVPQALPELVAGPERVVFRVERETTTDGRAGLGHSSGDHPASSDSVRIQAAVTAKLQRNRPVNSFTPGNTPTTQTRPDGRVYTNDLAYGTDLPNSFLDLWRPDEDLDRALPVLVYFHGGGFLFGDKVSGDPLAADSQTGIQTLISPFLDDGFAVICPEYAFAPDHRYPTQIVQADQVLRFIQHKHKEYGLDPERIVLMGGSAGADIVEIYGLVVTNEAYAKSLGVTPSVNAGQIRGLIIDEAALATRNLGDENMRILFQTWLGEEDIVDSEPAMQIAVPNHIAGAYPPAYINTSSLQPWFIRSATELRDALERQALPHEFFYRDQTFGELEHGYTNRHLTNHVARECFDGMRAFARAVVTNASPDEEPS